MKILAVDTSTMMSSISILDGDKIIGDMSINQEQTHSEKLVVLIKRLLDDLKITLKDIDLFAISKGPGSFTGLRIGMTTLKAMAQALDKDIIGVSTLEAMAFSILNNENILSIIDARGSRYFAGFYRNKNNNLEKEFERIIENEELFEFVKKLDNVVIVGDAIEKLPDEIKKLENVILSPASLNNSITRNICVIAKNRYEQGLIDNYLDLEPNYLRKSQAEINLKK